MNRSKYIVGTFGFLICSSMDEALFILMEERLGRAKKGEDPGYYDHNKFVQVDDQLIGQTLIVVEDSFGQTVRVLDEKGNSVPFEESRPLAYDKWGEPQVPDDHVVQPKMAGTSMNDNILRART